MGARKISVRPSFFTQSGHPRTANCLRTARHPAKQGLAFGRIVALGLASSLSAACLSLPSLDEDSINRAGTGTGDVDGWWDLLGQLDGTANAATGSLSAGNSDDHASGNGSGNPSDLGTGSSSSTDPTSTSTTQTSTTGESGLDSDELTADTGSTTEDLLDVGDSTNSSDAGGESEGVDPSELAHLRITELCSDPAGKDGGNASPEFVEIVNLGSSPFALDRLELVARSWPDLDGPGLGLEGIELGSDQVLVIERYAKGELATKPTLETDESVVWVRFEHGSGLRNSDGGVLVRDALNSKVHDLVVYGTSQEPPFDSWSTHPVDKAGSGLSLCRQQPSLDTDTAADFSSCEPTPGLWRPIDPMDDESTNGSESTDSGADDSESSTSEDDGAATDDTESSEATSSGDGSAGDDSSSADEGTTADSDDHDESCDGA